MSPVDLVLSSGLFLTSQLSLSLPCRLRYATPVEEASVSWRVRPSGLDRGLALEIKHHRERLVDPYVDVDRDEQQLREQRTARKEKRKALMEAAGVAK